MSPIARIVAALVAPVAALGGLWVSLLALLFVSMAAQRPDPSVPNGDPCCGHPDTWSEVVLGVGFGVLVGYVAAALVATGVALAFTAAAGRCPRVARRHPRALGAALAVATVGGLGLRLVL